MSDNVPGTRLRVLVLSLDASKALVMLRCTRALGHAAVACCDVAAAEERLRTQAWDALVVDLDALADGAIETLHVLASAIPAGRPCMLLGTAHTADPGDLLAWAAAGLDRLLPSDCQAADWRLALDPTLPPGFDPQPLAVLRELDPDVSRQSARALLSDTPRKLEVMRGGILRRDVGAARHAAHSLKGSASQLGALRVAGLCARLEAQLALGDLEAAAATWDDLAANWRAAEDRFAAEAEA